MVLHWNGQERIYARASLTQTNRLQCRLARALCIYLLVCFGLSFQNGFMQIFLSYLVTGEDASPCSPSCNYPENFICSVYTVETSPGSTRDKTNPRRYTCDLQHFTRDLTRDPRRLDNLHKAKHSKKKEMLKKCMATTETKLQLTRYGNGNCMLSLKGKLEECFVLSPRSHGTLADLWQVN